MRCIVQRVLRASVSIDGATHASIGSGLLILAGLANSDTPADWRWMAGKLPNLRIFPDEDGKMNRSVIDVIEHDPGQHPNRSGILAVPNFTVAGDTRKGRRPSFDGAMQPPEAEHAYLEFLRELGAHCPYVCSGVFGADMKVELVNDGPVTLVVESPVRGK